MTFRCLTVLLCLSLSSFAAPSGGPYYPSSVAVWFSPKGGCTEAVVAALNDAKKTIHVQAYSFTSAPIATALVDAKKRGVRVEVMLDKSQKSERYSEADFTAHAGIATSIDAAHAIAHNKVIIIDGSVVLTGSFNFTKAAEQSNAENLLLIRNQELAARYLENWKQHRAHSQEYAGR